LGCAFLAQARPDPQADGNRLLPDHTAQRRNDRKTVMFLPRFAVRLISTAYPREVHMSQLRALFARFGLFCRKPQTPDPFEGRLIRIGTRERRRDGGSPYQLFRN